MNLAQSSFPCRIEVLRPSCYFKILAVVHKLVVRLHYPVVTESGFRILDFYFNRNRLIFVTTNTTDEYPACKNY